MENVIIEYDKLFRLGFIIKRYKKYLNKRATEERLNSKDFKVIYDSKQPPAFEFINNYRTKYPTDYLAELLYDQ